MAKVKYLRICPKCKSAKVEVEKSNPLHATFGVPWMYVCQSCGHSGQVFPEVAIDSLKNVKKEKPIKQKSPQIDTSYGEFQVRFIWKILAPICFVLGLLLIPPILPVAIMMIVFSLVIGYFAYIKKPGLSP